MKKFIPCPDDASIMVRMREALQDTDIRTEIMRDYTTTFEQIGTSHGVAGDISERILDLIITSHSRRQFEEKKHSILQDQKIEGKPFLQVMSESMTGRADLIVKQLRPHILPFTLPLLDFGAGDGQVSQGIIDACQREVEAFDVEPFPHKSVRIPVRKYDGKRIPSPTKSYPDAIATNVLHHEYDNQVCIDELKRVTRQRIILIETVPVGTDKQTIERDRWRTFMNDVMWNSILKKPNTRIPIPGTYETPDGWIDRLEKNGWKCIHSENLGIDQKTIQDTHHLLVFDSIPHRLIRWLSHMLKTPYPDQ